MQGADGKTHYEPVLKPWRREPSARGIATDAGCVMAGAWVTIRVGAHPSNAPNALEWNALLLVHDELRSETTQAELTIQQLDTLIALLNTARRMIAPRDKKLLA